MSGRTSQSSGHAKLKDPALGIKGKNTKRKNIKGRNKSKNQNLPSDPRETQISYLFCHTPF